MKKILLGLSIVASLSFSSEDICYDLYKVENYQKSGDCYLKQLKISNSFDNNFHAGSSLLNQGRIKEGLPYLQKAEQLASSEKELSDTYSYLSSAYSDLGNDELDLAYSMKFLNNSLKRNHKKDISNAYNNLGVYYRKIKDYDKALEYYNKSLEFTKEKDKASGYGNIAILYQELKNYDKANEFHNKSINAALNSGDYLGLCVLKTNFGGSLYFQKNYQEADKTLKEANIICHNASEISVEANSFIFLGLSSLKQNDLPSAKSYYNQAKPLANKSGSSDILDNLADLEKRINSYNQ